MTSGADLFATVEFCGFKMKVPVRNVCFLNQKFKLREAILLLFG